VIKDEVCHDLFRHQLLRVVARHPHHFPHTVDLTLNFYLKSLRVSTGIFSYAAAAARALWERELLFETRRSAGWPQRRHKIDAINQSLSTWCYIACGSTSSHTVSKP